ncbi:MAG: ATP-binding protein [Candidatus Paceibacterota bacterium]
MTPEVFNLIQACEWAPSQFLVFSDNVFESFIYYSHLGSIIPTLLIALFIFIYGRKEFSSILLLLTSIFFSLWVFSDLVLWATEFPSYTMFFWALEIVCEPLVYFFSFYFFYVYVFKKDLSVLQKILFLFPLLPTFVFASTRLGLLGYDISNCDRAASEGILATYGYAIEILYTLLIIGFAIFVLIKAKESVVKKRTALLAVGIVLFLLSFSIGNIVEVFSQDWSIGRYGLFGAPVFVAFLAYLIVQYRAFNVRLIGAQALVAAFWLSVLSLLFIRTVEDVRIITSVTLIFVLIAGILLVRGVKREIAQREKIQKLAEELQDTNERQEGLLHFIGHEVKGFLTKDAGAFAAISQGDFGTPPDGMKPFVDQALIESRQGADSVSNILKASNLKKGAVTYVKEPFDLEALAREAVEKARAAAERKGLTLTFVADGASYQMTGDKAQLSDHVLRNIIDNSINYTSSGSIAVSLKRDDGKLVFAVKDTGIGIDEDDKKHLFTEGGHGKDSQRVNVHSTGYGLYIAKQIAEAHGGTIRAESEGRDKGSTFFVEFPVV